MNVKTIDFSTAVNLRSRRQTGGEAKRGWKEGDNAGYTGVCDIKKLIRGATFAYLEKFSLNCLSSIRVNLLHP